MKDPSAFTPENDLLMFFSSSISAKFFAVNHFIFSCGSIGCVGEPHGFKVILAGSLRVAIAGNGIENALVAIVNRTVHHSIIRIDPSFDSSQVGVIGF
jgi:hypothetical protein